MKSTTLTQHSSGDYFEGYVRGIYSYEDGKAAEHAVRSSSDEHSEDWKRGYRKARERRASNASRHG